MPGGSTPYKPSRREIPGVAGFILMRKLLCAVIDTGSSADLDY